MDIGLVQISILTILLQKNTEQFVILNKVNPNTLEIKIIIKLDITKHVPTMEIKLFDSSKSTRLFFSHKLYFNEVVSYKNSFI